MVTLTIMVAIFRKNSEHQLKQDKNQESPPPNPSYPDFSQHIVSGKLFNQDRTNYQRKESSNG